MKIFKISIFMLLFSIITITFSSCSNEQFENTTDKSQSIKNENFAARTNVGLGSFEYGSKLFEVQENKSVGYYINENYIGNISVADSNLLVTDNSEINQELILENTISGETIKVKNLREYDNYALFDLVLSNGTTLDDVKFNYENASRACVWCPFVEVAAAIVSVAISVFDSEDTSPSAQCTKAFEAVKCPKGKSPFMNFQEGNWFSGPSCSVGCN